MFSNSERSDFVGLTPDPSIIRRALLAERDIYARRRGPDPIGRRSAVMVGLLERRLKYPEDARAAHMAKQRAKDMELTILSGPPQVVGSYDPERPFVFVRA